MTRKHDIAHIYLSDPADLVSVTVIHENGDEEVIYVHGDGEVCTHHDQRGNTVIKPGRTPDDA